MTAPALMEWARENARRAIGDRLDNLPIDQREEQIEAIAMTIVKTHEADAERRRQDTLDELARDCGVRRWKEKR